MDPNQTSAALDLELKQKTIEALRFIGTEITDNYSSGKAFIIEQAPLVVKEMVHWGITEAAMYVFIFGAVHFFCLFSITKLIKRKDLDLDFKAPIIIVLGVISFFFIYPFIHHLFVLAQALVAPRLFLLEQAAHLLK